MNMYIHVCSPQSKPMKKKKKIKKKIKEKKKKKKKRTKNNILPDGPPTLTWSVGFKQTGGPSYCDLWMICQ